MSQHICYFSKKCRFCQGFLEELARSPYTKEVTLVCVDPSPSRPPLPAWLKMVPTMILANGEEPLIGPMAVNNWLFSRRLLQKGGSPSDKPMQQKDAFKERTEPLKIPDYSPEIAPRPGPAPKQGGSSSTVPVTGASDGEPLPWHGEEMAGGNWSDAYSFVDDSFTAEKGQNRIVRNFELLGGPLLPQGQGSQSSAGKPPQQKSAKEDKLLREFEAFSKMRDMEFSGPKRMG